MAFVSDRDGNAKKTKTCQPAAEWKGIGVGRQGEIKEILEWSLVWANDLDREFTGQDEKSEGIRADEEGKAHKGHRDSLANSKSGYGEDA